MNALSVANVTKAFGEMRAVDDLSFEVRPGEIFAMLGPNGAGKTTTLRMVLDILRPDSGQIEVLGSPISPAAKDRIGYLPEERGLYTNLSVVECLAYLGTLKGMKSRTARTRALELLGRVELAEHAHKKVRELSRGMQQKAQFVATILHNPDLVIVDEPFSGLDPVNTLLVKELMYELKQQGKTVIMSTHAMRQVEEMADRLLMIDQGRRVLYGPVEEIRRQYAAHAVYVHAEGEWASLPGIKRVAFDEREKASLVFLNEATSADDLLRSLVQQPSIHVRRFEMALPSLDDIFIEVVGNRESVISNDQDKAQ
ncbi:MAG: ATP-binding cassette domain-containing protein [Chloroflexota bacterium]